MNHTNDLIHETSPYLLQHARNPVNWKPWKEAVLEQARKGDKLMIVSIGYSACHWCHVMEKESFENEDIAAIMNEYFVSIKVDREERPDVDQVYMDAAQAITGRGGWPLNAITLPDGRPIYAGTYFNPSQWKQLLLYFIDYWHTQPEDARRRADEIAKGLKTLDEVPIVSSELSAQFKPEVHQHILDGVARNFDTENGGRVGAPKFPMPVVCEYLLQHYYHNQNAQALKMAETYLMQMYKGGIYDHVAGGFARYSVDDTWEIPHFEKMLYDNAQLVSVYSKMYSITRNETYKQVVDETLQFIASELTAPNGLFYCALDADSEGEEGRYYVWTKEELQQVLGEEFEHFSKVYATAINFEGHIHLRMRKDASGEMNVKKEWKSMLAEKRSKRVRPGLDDKSITSWNAMMITAYVDAYTATGNNKYLEAANVCAHYIGDEMLQVDGNLLRTCKNGKKAINGFLDDYAFTIEAFIKMYSVTLSDAWLKRATGLTEYAVQHFYNTATGLFFYTSLLDSPLISRKYELSDNVIPSSNAVMADNLLVLASIQHNNSWVKMAERMLMTQLENVMGYPWFYARWATVMHRFTHAQKEVVVTGTEALHLLQQLQQNYRPDCVYAGGTTESSAAITQNRFIEGKTLVYICSNNTCEYPVDTAEQAEVLLSKH